MKRYTALLLTAALLCTGCVSIKVNDPGVGSSKGEETAETVEAVTDSALTDISDEAAADITREQETADIYATIETEETPAQTAEQEQTALLFKPGTWRGSSQYYFFREDGESGETQNFSLGMGVGFRYELDGKNVMFHFGAADDNSPAVASEISADKITLKWDNGASETIVFVSPEGEDSFVYYTDVELAEIAQKYFGASNDHTPQSASVKSNFDGTVTIQLYDNLGDHNATSAWYTIDRVTLKGTDDISLTEVDMSEYA